MEREGKSHIRNVLRISTSEEALGFLEPIVVVRRFVFDNVRPKDSQGFPKTFGGWPLRFDSSSRWASISSNK